MEEQIRAVADEAGGASPPPPCWWGGECDWRCMEDRSRQQRLNRRLAALQSMQASEMRLAALQGMQEPPPNKEAEQPSP